MTTGSAGTIFVAGHRGMVGSAIVRCLQALADVAVQHAAIVLNGRRNRLDGGLTIRAVGLALLGQQVTQRAEGAVTIVPTVVWYPTEIVNTAAGFVYGFWPALIVCLTGWTVSGVLGWTIGRMAGPNRRWRRVIATARTSSVQSRAGSQVRPCAYCTRTAIPTSSYTISQRLVLVLFSSEAQGS